MAQKVPQDQTELCQQLLEQLAFLKASAASYDAGFEGEAKRLAVVLRVLLHDTRRSKGLLATLDIKTRLEFHDVVGKTPSSSGIFVGLSMGFTERGVRYYPKLHEARRRMTFDEWWDAPIMVSAPQNIRFTRKDAVLHLADTDGGAHVDPALERAYYALSRRNAFGWEVRVGGGEGEVENSPALPIARQVAHEVVCTLDEQTSELIPGCSPTEIS